MAPTNVKMLKSVGLRRGSPNQFATLVRVSKTLHAIRSRPTCKLVRIYSGQGETCRHLSSFCQIATSSNYLSGMITRANVDDETEFCEFDWNGVKKRKINFGMPGVQLSAPIIPPETKLRTEKFRKISYTMLWPAESSLEAEAALYAHFLKYASALGGSAPLYSKKFINSPYASFYECIVRYTDGKHRNLCLRQQRNNQPVYDHLDLRNNSISSAVQDIRFYTCRYNLPLAVLVGEGESRWRYPHCTCLIFRYYNDAWEVVLKDCTNVDSMDVRPVAKSLLTLLGYKTVYFIPLSKAESERESINCLGQGIHTAATLLDGKMHDIFSSVPNTAIWQFDLINNKFLDNNKLNGIPIVTQHLPILQTVKIVDTPKIRAKLKNFRKKVTLAGAQFLNIGQTEDDQDMVVEVEEVYDRTTVKGKLYYKIRWVGFDSEHDSWMSTDQLEMCKETVMAFDRAFEQRLKEKPKFGRKKNCNYLTLEKAMPTWFGN